MKVRKPEPLPSPEHGQGTLPGLVALLRVRQWPKNLVVLAALLFAGRFTDPRAVFDAALALAAFLLLSSAVYALNDALDAPRDRQHPEKRLRPVASGAVSPALAYGFGLGLALAGLGLGLLLPRGFLFAALAYLASTTLYSLWAKHQVILDVLFLALGFVLRAAAGALALNVEISAWLLLCATLLALLLGLGKRRAELTLLKGTAGGHRSALEEYSQALLDQMIAVVASGTVIAYALYTFSNHTRAGQPVLMLTLPFVLYGVFRYLYLQHRKGMGGKPEEVLLTDRAMLVNVALWGAASAAILLTTK